jgi:hypothetical protein
MKPINLLTTGRTIRGMTNTRSAYKVTGHALPRFGRARLGPLRVDMDPPQQPLLVPLMVAEPAPAKETPAPLNAAACDMADAPTHTTPEPQKSVTTRIWNFWRQAAPKAKSEIPPPPPPLRQEPAIEPPTPAATKAKAGIWRLLLQRITFRRRVVKVRGIQTELALERVAVIRNDLSDADLEVIPRMDAKKRESNPFRGSAKARRAKQAEEARNAPAYAQLCEAGAGKPTD